MLRRSKSEDRGPEKPMRPVFQDLTAAYESITRSSPRIDPPKDGIKSTHDPAGLESESNSRLGPLTFKPSGPGRAFHRRSASMTALETFRLSTMSLDSNSMDFPASPKEAEFSGHYAGLELDETAGSQPSLANLSHGIATVGKKAECTPNVPLIQQSAHVQEIPSRHQGHTYSSSEDGVEQASTFAVQVESPKAPSTLDEQVGQCEDLDQFAWSPRSSSEHPEMSQTYMDNNISLPPAFSLPPRPSYQPNLSSEPSTLGEETLGSFRSYGNTRNLLDLPPVSSVYSNPNEHSLLYELSQLTKDPSLRSVGPSSSDSFAIAMFRDASGSLQSRSLSEDEYRTLEREISTHLIPSCNNIESASMIPAGVLEVRVLDDPDKQGPGRSQSPTNSQNSQDLSGFDFGLAQRESLRMLSNTSPPHRSSKLLDGSSKEQEADWETVAESYHPSLAYSGCESVADYSDSSTHSHPLGGPSSDSRTVMAPMYPRYNRSWSLHRNALSGALYLTPTLPCATTSRGQSASPALPVPRLAEYSHPAPLKHGHAHPFSSGPPITSSEHQDRIFDQHNQQGLSREATGRSFPSSVYLSTVEELDSDECGSPRNHQASFDQLVFLGTKANVTGTPEGTGARIVGSSLADASSPYNPNTLFSNSQNQLSGRDTSQSQFNGSNDVSSEDDVRILRQNIIRDRWLPKLSGLWSKASLKSKGKSPDEGTANGGLPAETPNGNEEPASSHDSDQSEIIRWNDIHTALTVKFFGRFIAQHLQNQRPQNVGLEPMFGKNKSHDPTHPANQSTSSGNGCKEEHDHRSSKSGTDGCTGRANPLEETVEPATARPAVLQPQNEGDPDAITPAPALTPLNTPSGVPPEEESLSSKIQRVLPFIVEPHPPRGIHRSPSRPRFLHGLPLDCPPRPGIRASSPHLHRRRNKRKPSEAMVQRRKEISRLVLVLCFTMPWMFILFYAGYLDGIMDYLTNGEFETMRDMEKRLALLFVCSIVLIIVIGMGIWLASL
ncbi:MAG: hypothetical protein Q9167_002518 [Letrouitia subvulpina]